MKIRANSLIFEYKNMKFFYLSITKIAFVFLLIIPSIVLSQLTNQKRIASDSASNKHNVILPEVKAGFGFDSSNSRIKDLVKTQIRKFNLTGTANLESYASSFQNPRVLSEAKYIRFSSYNSLDLFGLPFTSDIYYTTEQNILFNSNHISFSFDKQRFIDQNLRKSNEKIQLAKQKLDYKQYQTVLLDKSRHQLEEQKKQLSASQKEYENQLRTTAQKEKDNQIIRASDSLVNSNGNMFTKVLSYEDSIRNEKDGLLNEINMKRLMADTHRINRKYKHVSNKLDSANLKYQKYKQQYTKDSAKLADFLEMHNKPDQKLGKWLDDNKRPTLSKIFGNVNDFNIGSFVSMVHPMSNYGMNTRGLQLGYSIDNLELSLNAGKTIPNDIFSYSRSSGSFDRNALSLSAEYPMSENHNVMIFGHHIYDPKIKRTKESKEAYVNSVYGFAAESQIIEKVKLKGNLAKSRFYVSNRTGITGEVKVKPHITSFRSQSSYDLEAVSGITNTTELEAKYSYVGPNYRNLGNPFMRVNFLEYRAKLKQGFFNRQIKTTLFYKQLSDNPLKVNETTNTTSGYGFSIRSRFKNRKLPNFNFHISPYEQGNNHPDSLFRVNNQFQLMMGGITYFRQIKSIGINIGVFGSNSVSQLSDSFLASVNTVNGNFDLTLGTNLTIGGGFTAIRSKPYVDSSHVDVYQLRVNYKLGKRMSIGTDAFMSDYASGSYRKGAKLQFRFAAGKGFNITLQTGYDKYFRLWGIENADAWSGLLRLQMRF